MIKANAHKYSVSAMCRVLQVNRSTYYYEAAAKKDESELTADIQEIFRKSRNHYGTRKIKKELADCGKLCFDSQSRCQEIQSERLFLLIEVPDSSAQEGCRSGSMFP